MYMGRESEKKKEYRIITQRYRLRNASCALRWHDRDGVPSANSLADKQRARARARTLLCTWCCGLLEQRFSRTNKTATDGKESSRVRVLRERRKPRDARSRISDFILRPLLLFRTWDPYDVSVYYSCDHDINISIEIGGAYVYVCVCAETRSS